MASVRTFGGNAPDFSYIRSIAAEHDANVVLDGVTIDDTIIPTLEGLFKGRIILLRPFEGDGLIIMVGGSDAPTR